MSGIKVDDFCSTWWVSMVFTRGTPTLSVFAKIKLPFAVELLEREWGSDGGGEGYGDEMLEGRSSVVSGT